ncbi:MAG TPA: amidase family protein, partial [Casimicrobiaceae bacterium]|nr:amidase family protein [Casimicrobiaceae bacterium]
LSASLDSVGPLTRSVDDALWLVAAMAGEELPAPAAPPGLDGVRITALAPAQFPDFIEPDVVDAFERALARLRELGASVRDERIPFDFAALGARNGRIIGIEGYAAHREVMDDPSADVDPGVRQRMLLARAATAAEYLDALAQRREAMAAFDAWMRDRDALATPMLPITARAVAEVDETTYPLATWSRAVNYLGACAISVPAPLPRGGLPVGVQLVGRAGGDDVVSRIGAAALRGEPLARPPVGSA